MTYQSPGICIIDQLLEPAFIEELRGFVVGQRHDKIPLRSTAKGMPADHDVSAQRAAAFYGGNWGSLTPARRLPTGTPIDGFSDALLTAAATAPAVVGTHGNDWFGFSVTPWALPAGAAFHVHSDGPETYSGGFVFFLVEAWPVDFGGLLLIVEPSPYEGTMLSLGIHPVENRLVFLSPTVVHAVTRIDQNAGASLRRTLVGFFG